MKQLKLWVILLLNAPMLIAIAQKTTQNVIANKPLAVKNTTAFYANSFAAIDAESDKYIPGNKVYNKTEAIDLRNDLLAKLQANPQSAPLNWALCRFYACAPNFVGGNRGVALMYAANLFSLNNYAGCLAYEYVYSKHYDFERAERWYKRSLMCNLPSGMQWKEVKYLKNVPFGVGVSGNFSNNKAHPLYESYFGTYVRKFMIPACGNTCQYKFVPAFMRDDNGNSNQFIVALY